MTVNGNANSPPTAPSGFVCYLRRQSYLVSPLLYVCLHLTGQSRYSHNGSGSRSNVSAMRKHASGWLRISSISPPLHETHIHSFKGGAQNSRSAPRRSRSFMQSALEPTRPNTVKSRCSPVVLLPTLTSIQKLGVVSIWPQSKLSDDSGAFSIRDTAEVYIKIYTGATPLSTDPTTRTHGPPD